MGMEKAGRQTVKLRQSLQQHLLSHMEMFSTWSLSTRSHPGNGKSAFVQSLAHLFEMDAS